MNAPCYNQETHTDCPKRCVGCRSNCKDWSDYEAAKKEEYERRYMAKKDRVNPYTRRKQVLVTKLLNRNKR